ncbi:cell division protein FtsZ [Sphingomonas sp. PB4P5]|uniref:cell division protein FtsZ n=1 Tax=Parasphingomonas puruogangriensis TaxID=3096155 RepID=UPI002FC7B582
MGIDQAAGASAPVITVFGVGGAGGNAVRDLIAGGARGLNIVCANTDTQALRTVPPAHRLQLGRVLTAGLGAGARPEIGRAAAEEAVPEIRQALEGSSLCFIAAGMGGGTGSGAAPVIARIAREMDILTVGVATKPFAFEGKRRLAIADAALAELRPAVDALVTVCNQNLFRVIGAETTLATALARSDAIIRDSARDFALLLGGSAMKRVALADLRAMLRGSGDAMIGFGACGAGPERALHAARAALDYPLLDGMGPSATRLLVTVAGGEDLGLFEIEQAMAWLRASLPAASELVWGAVIDPALAGRVRVGVMAAALSGIAMPVVETVAEDAVDLLDALCADVAARPEPLPVAPYPLYCEPLVMPNVPMPAACGAMAAEAGAEAALPLAVVGGAPPLQRPQAAVERIRSRTARPSLADRIYDAARDLTRRPALHGVLQPAPRATPVFHVTKPFAPTPARHAA